MQKFSLSLLMIVSLILTGCFKNDSWLEKVDGVYYGLMWSGGGNLGCTTTFEVDFNGNLTGTYVMLEPLSAEEGVIDKCVLLKKGKFQCKWRDLYGFGDVELEFTRGFNSFKAIWNDEGEFEQSFPWIGKKDSPHIQKAKIILETVDVNNLFKKITDHHFNQIINIYPMIKDNKTIFYDYYKKYLSFSGVKEELVSFIISQFSKNTLHKLSKKENNRTSESQEMIKSIEFQSVVIGRSKANKHFDEFLDMMDKKEKNESSAKTSHTAEGL